MGTAALWAHLEEFDTGAPLPLQQALVQPAAPSPEVEPAVSGTAKPEPTSSEVREAAWQEGYDAAKTEYEALLEKQRAEAQAQLELEQQKREAADVSEIGTKITSAYESLEASVGNELRSICVPYLKELAHGRCLEDFSEVVRTLLRDSTSVNISGRGEQLDALKSFLSNAELELCSFTESDLPEIEAVSDRTRLQTSLTAWLENITGGENAGA